MNTEKNIQDLIQNNKNTGSPEYQISLFTKRILYLTEHFKTHIHDHHSKRGLINLVAKRRRLLNYLKRSNLLRYKTLIVSLRLRK